MDLLDFLFPYFHLDNNYIGKPFHNPFYYCFLFSFLNNNLPFCFFLKDNFSKLTSISYAIIEFIIEHEDSKANIYCTHAKRYRSNDIFI